MIIAYNLTTVYAAAIFSFCFIFFTFSFVIKGYLGKICFIPYSNVPMTDLRRSFMNWLKDTEIMNF